MWNLPPPSRLLESNWASGMGTHTLLSSIADFMHTKHMSSDVCRLEACVGSNKLERVDGAWVPVAGGVHKWQVRGVQTLHHRPATRTEPGGSLPPVHHGRGVGSSTNTEATFRNT